MRFYVDISSNNGTPNLAAYRAAGYTDLMMKATEGTGYYWPQMQALARQWHSFGPAYRVGYYHWLYGTLSGSAQHAWFWSKVSPVWRAGDWIMTDFEDVDPSRWASDAQHLSVVKEFDALCSAHGPVHDYAPSWYLANLPQCVAYFRGRQVVASDYSHNPPLNPYGLNYVAHQLTDRQTVPGFSGPVDYNQWLTSGETTSSTGTELEIDDVTPQDIAAIAAAVKEAVWNEDMSGVGFKAPARLVLANTLKNATTAAGSDPLDESLTRAGVGPAPVRIWIADARNLAAQGNATATKALEAVAALAGQVNEVLQTLQHLSTTAGSGASAIDPKPIVEAFGAALTKGISE